MIVFWAIFGIILTLAFILILTNLVGTDEAYITVLSFFDKRITGYRYPGWSVTWPWTFVYGRIYTGIQSVNVRPFEVLAMIEDTVIKDGEVVTTGSKGPRAFALVRLKSGEVSHSFELNFEPRRRLDSKGKKVGFYTTLSLLRLYYRLQKKMVDETGQETNITVLDERVRDIIQAAFRRQVMEYDVNEARNLPRDEIQDKILPQIKGSIEKEIPFMKVIDISMNEPFDVVDPEAKAALDRRGQHSLQLEEQRIAAQTELTVATIGVKTATQEAEAQAVAVERNAAARAEAVRKIAEAYGYSGLSKEEQARLNISREQIDAVKALAESNNKVFVVGDMFEAMKTLGKKVTGGK